MRGDPVGDPVSAIAAPATPPARLGDAPELGAILAFLRDIGVAVVAAQLTEPTFLPGMTVRGRTLVYDPAQPGWVGDLLHEAGHIALGDPARTDTHDVDDDPAAEMATLAWSHAAACAIGMAPDVLFHAGCKGGGAYLVRAFADACPIGLPMLQYWGMAARADEAEPPYPAMRCWLRPPDQDTAL